MEEDIKILKKMCTENWCIGHNRVKQAIENLISRNRELEYKLREHICIEAHEQVKQLYIPKSKINNEINYLKQKYDLEEDYTNYKEVVEILQELLEES